MKAALSVLLTICAIGLAAPAPAPANSASSLELKSVIERAVGDKCRAPEGSGDCRNTGKCKGISYPTGLCPKDPKDVQVSDLIAFASSRLGIMRSKEARYLLVVDTVLRGDSLQSTLC